MPRVLNLIPRLAILAASVALVIAAVSSFERSLPVRPQEKAPRRFHRPLAPQPLRAGEFAEEFLILASVAFFGRKVLRLRL